MMEEMERDVLIAAALYVAAKAPRVGLAKTRLGRSIGHEFAIALYRAFLRDLAARFADAPFECSWYVTPSDAWADISPLVGWDGCRARVLFQKEGDWTERQQELFREAATRGEERVVLIASDSPHLTVEVVALAFRELDRHDLVFGPTHDGGYYLIGMRGFHDVLRGVAMSTGTELDGISTRAEHAGLSVGWVEPTFDVDEVEDLEHLRPLAATRADLAATRATLEKLGLNEDGRHTTFDPNGTRSTAASPATGPAATAEEPK
jgi:rSAM/selenodomain-associated transferase 1